VTFLKLSATIPMQLE